jgi:SNF2 family DNA or RNA helicase
LDFKFKQQSKFQATLSNKKQLLLQNSGFFGDEEFMQILTKSGLSKRSDPNLGGKMRVLDRMLNILYTEKKVRVVLISNYTETLDMFRVFSFQQILPFFKVTE